MPFSGGVPRPTFRAAPLLLLLQSALVAPMSITPLTGRTRSFDVTFRRDGEEHVLRVPEGMPILQAAEAAGLMPTSECRRGNCLSCVATVVSGAPFSLRVSDSTALCELAKDAQLVPLCSAFVTGPNLSMDLDDGPSKAWDLQYREQFASDPAPLSETVPAAGPALSPWAVFSSIDDSAKAGFGGRDVQWGDREECMEDGD